MIELLGRCHVSDKSVLGAYLAISLYSMTNRLTVSMPKIQTGISGSGMPYRLETEEYLLVDPVCRMRTIHEYHVRYYSDDTDGNDALTDWIEHEFPEVLISWDDGIEYGHRDLSVSNGRIMMKYWGFSHEVSVETNSCDVAYKVRKMIEKHIQTVCAKM